MFEDISSSRNGYDIVRYQTAQMEKASITKGYKIEHFVILFNGEPVGALTNEHFKDNWRVITQDGRQIGPGDYDTKIDFKKVLEFIFNLNPSTLMDKRVYIKLTTEMGFVKYGNIDEGYWITSDQPKLFQRDRVPDLIEIMKQLDHCYTHPYGDIIKKIEMVPHR